MRRLFDGVVVRGSEWRPSNQGLRGLLQPTHDPLTVHRVMTIGNLVRPLAFLLLCCPPETVGAQATRYEGTVTNHGYATQPTTQGITGTLRWDAIGDDASRGTLSIGSPLGGSGAAVYRAWADTVVFGSVSMVGDTIFWLGTI